MRLAAKLNERRIDQPFRVSRCLIATAIVTLLVFLKGDAMGTSGLIFLMVLMSCLVLFVYKAWISTCSKTVLFLFPILSSPFLLGAWVSFAESNAGIWACGYLLVVMFLGVTTVFNWRRRFIEKNLGSLE